jgi:hypothetical protein
MINVITTVHKHGNPVNEHDTKQNPAWRIHTCVVDFGNQESQLMFSPAAVYPSLEVAHAASRAEALERIRARGHTELEDEIVWKLQIIP